MRNCVRLWAGISLDFCYYLRSIIMQNVLMSSWNLKKTSIVYHVANHSVEILTT